MKKLLFLSLVLVAACSQADKHPAMLGDCDVCTPNLGGGTISEGGVQDSGGTDAAGNDGGVTDAANDATLDVEIPDVGLPDVIDLDGASE